MSLVTVTGISPCLSGIDLFLKSKRSKHICPIVLLESANKNVGILTLD